MDSTIFNNISNLKSDLDKFRPMDNAKIQEALDIEYTYESNRIEGNTLTLQETQMVIEKGLTISGKSLNEHLEAINHKEAIDFIKDIVKNESELTESTLKQIHSIVLKSIDKVNAGVYRVVPVMISGTTFLPPQPYLLNKLMEDYFHFYQENKAVLHPVVLAAEMHERLVTIHPFIDGNGRTSRLIMNLILLQHGYPIANIQGDYESRMKYYAALENAQVHNDKSDFISLIAGVVEASLERYLSILK
ncbi:MAG: Fic family protein [Limnohabitans sp.]|nr:Fic family protein [Limnohabitans sp.]